MRNLKRDSIVQIELDLIADADKADAWEAPIKVLPGNSPRPDWYRQEEATPIGITASCGEVDAQEVYNFITKNVTGVTAYTLRPQGGPHGASLDFYLVLGTVTSAISIADILWKAYERFIASRKRREGDSAGIYIAVQRANGEVIQLRLGDDVLTQEDFLKRFAEFITEISDPKLRPAHEAKLRELSNSDSWEKITKDS